jgi:transposase
MVREGMRGADQQQNHIFSYLSPEERVRKDHPLRAVRAMVDEVLQQLSRRFDAMYAKVGRPSIPRNNCCERSCCRCCTRFGASGC